MFPFMNPEEHGKEMMSQEIEAEVTPNNQPGETDISTTSLLMSFSDGTKMTIECSLSSLDVGRVEVDRVPAKTGVMLFKKLQSVSGSFVLMTYGETFEIPSAISVYGFFDDLCAISFTTN